MYRLKRKVCVGRMNFFVENTSVPANPLSHYPLTQVLRSVIFEYSVYKLPADILRNLILRNLKISYGIRTHRKKIPSVHFSTEELKKNGSADLYYTWHCAGKDMGRLPCAMLDQSTEHFFFYNAVSVKTVIFGPFFVLKKLRAGDFVMRKCQE